MRVAGNRVIEGFRVLAGTTDPTTAAPGTIRGDFGRDWGLKVQQNLVHGSDSVESAERELALWFAWIAEGGCGRPATAGPKRTGSATRFCRSMSTSGIAFMCACASRRPRVADHRDERDPPEPLGREAARRVPMPEYVPAASCAAESMHAHVSMHHGHSTSST